MRQTRKTLALVLVIAMVFGLLATSSLAANPISLTTYGESVGGISVSGADIVDGAGNCAVSTNSFGTVYDYYLTLDADTADGTAVTATFSKSADADSTCMISRVGVAPNPPQGPQIIYANSSLAYTATVSEGTALTGAYVHHAVPDRWQQFDTYNFHFHLPYPISISTGDPVFIAWDGNSGTVAGRNGSESIPGSFTLWVEGASSITVDGAAQSASYSDTTGGVTNYAFEISTKSTAMTITAVSGGTTYTITCPAKTTTPAGSAPTSVVSYLPLGQYAGGTVWGSSSGKFAGKTGLDSTGVSLGALGGYIEFYFADGIENNPNNPYGVDFVVYGNAFNGNPEAGAVQVSEDGKTWYELAGSLYYDGGFSIDTSKATGGKYSNVYTGTLRNTTVNYTLGNDIQVTLGGNGPATFTTATAWWPLTTEGYPMDGAYSNTGSNITVNHSNSALSFSGITAVQDSNATAFYAFGYADVTPNGSPAAYGNAVNPYTPYTSSKTGGDGFDLEWAVDIATGEPVDVDGMTFRYVRVYSAVLDNATFGETSTEVCGIFTTANAAGDSVGRTAAPTVKYGTSSTVMNRVISTATNATFSTSVPAGTYYINAAGSADNLFINGDRVESGSAYEFTVTSGATTYLRIIAQDGTQQPFIKLVEFVGK